MNKIVERIEREAGIPDLVAILAQRLAPTDLQSVLLEVFRVRARSLRPAEVLSSFETNRFVRPSPVSPTRLLQWDETALSHLPTDFEALALSPVTPLGTSSAVASVDQNWAVSTARNTEVVSDPTNVLALECAVRRRELLRADPASTIPVHLAASHRLVRAQRYDSPLSATHFASFVLCSAGRDQPGRLFGLTSIGLHIRFYLSALRTFLGQAAPLAVTLTDFSRESRNDMLEAKLLAPLRLEFGQLRCVVDDGRSAGRGYYPGLCFHIYATTPRGQPLELVDGGSVDWMGKLLSNRKERLVISGLGSERLCQEFGDSQYSEKRKVEDRPGPG
jgi:hypothetical protein